MDGVVGMVVLANYQKTKHRLAAQGLPPGASAVVVSLRVRATCSSLSLVSD